LGWLILVENVTELKDAQKTVTPIWYVCEGVSIDRYVKKMSAKPALNVCNTGQ
jgi:hypothetical protein